jgi:uncharacterized membrane protein YraQ (UPF0718 family)
MRFKDELKPLVILTSVFLLFFYLPVGNPRFDSAILEAFYLAKWYAREHVVFCLIPAFFIAGAISVFISQASVMKYLGARANKVLAYGVASVSGSILAVCSCTVLPLFAGIYRMGAGIGPASAFLYSGPAINVLAIILTARILGMQIGIARAVCAVGLSIIIGLLMHFIFRKEEIEKAQAQMMMPESEVVRPLWQNVLYFASMVGILVFANWAKPQESSGTWFLIYSSKWIITSIFAIGLAVIFMVWFKVKPWLVIWSTIPIIILALIFPSSQMIPFVAGVIGLIVIAFSTKGEMNYWANSTWGFAKQIIPLLFFGVLISGALLGRPDHEGLIPSSWISTAVGGNSIWSNLFASIVGAFMYFATLTEVPILQGLIGSGMGKGPALSLLLAGPALSLPSMLVIKSIMGLKKTVVFIILVVIMSTICGIIFGSIF